MKYITLNKEYDMKLNSQITKYMTPKFVFLPLESEEKKLSNLQIKKEETILNTMISPISGKIMGTQTCTLESGEPKKCLVIENDYKETLEKKNSVRKNITKLTKNEWIQELQQGGQKNLIKKLENSEKILICNIIEDEPYVENETFLSVEYTNIILETLDALRVVGFCQNIIIAIKNKNQNVIETFTNFLGTYPQISLRCVPDYYLLEQESYLKEYLKIEKGIVLRPSEIIRLYNIIKRRKKMTEHIFTISGNAIKNPQVIETKIGCSIKEILKEKIEYLEEEQEIYINGLMKGFTFDIKKLIVTEELKSIFIMKKEQNETLKCMNCGKCYQICPVGCNPRAYLQKKRTEDIKNCIDCGLCSYICPSFINLRKIIRGDEK